MTGADYSTFAASIADRYRLERELGRGAWGVVFAAHDIANDRQVAIKLLRGEYTGSVSGERFRREIDILRQLHHPQIISLYDAGEYRDAPWYAMSYVDGESLRDRLDRERQLPIGEALRIARGVADALAHAHQANVVHRDIKPANILLHGNEVLVADFGIARAIDNSAAHHGITSSGLQIGTPTYMSPEQASADRAIDGRSDIYSLACVLYEMLAGAPPFSAPSAAALIARHMMDPVPRLSTVRQSAPPALEAVIYQALAKSPADRFASAAEFSRALESVASQPHISVAVNRPAQRRTRRVLIAGSALMLAGAVAFTAWSASQRSSDAKAVVEADTSRIVVFPFDAGANAGTSGADEAMRQALLKWSGVQVVPPSTLAEAMGSRKTGLTQAEFRAMALGLHAGRFIRGSVDRDASGLHAHAMLFDVARSAAPLVEATQTGSGNGVGLDSAFARLAEHLLFRTADSAALSASSGTTSAPAREAYLQGATALEHWDLAAADSSFAAATTFDKHYARAFLWLALSRVWAQKDTGTWRYAAIAAAAARAQLSVSDQAKSDALASLAGGDRVGACKQWDALTVREPNDFSTWYGAADCLIRDNAVLADPRSPSGWRFRSGYHSGLQRYRRAFELRPSVLSALAGNAFEGARDLLKTSGVNMRTGHDAQGRFFMAYPSWDDDTLSCYPFPLDVIGGNDPKMLRQLPKTIGVAVRHQRELFRQVATAWTASEPQNADALEASALSLLLLGEQSSLDTIARARTLASSAAQRQRVASAEVWMTTQFALPGDLRGLRRARLLADSLLSGGNTASRDVHVLASIAALTGHAFRADSIEGSIQADFYEPTMAPVRSMARRLVILAAFGGPVDSLRALEHRVDSVIMAVVAPQRRTQTRVEALQRAAVLAFPSVRFAAIKTLPTNGFYMLDAEAALARGDTARGLNALTRLRISREAFALPELRLDGLYPEAWFISATGDTKGAIAWLDPSLARLRVAASLVDPIQAAILVRTMVFRAELAESVGDTRTAARWAAAVAELWANADDFLQPVVKRMQVMSLRGAR